MSGFGDIKDLLGAVGLANQSLVTNSEEAKRILAQQELDRKAQEQSISRVGAADAQLITADQVVKQQVQKQTQDFATRIGANPDTGAEVLNMLATQWKESAISASQKAKKLEDDLSVDFLDSPIQYIKAQIGMEGTIKEADAAAMRRNTNHQALIQAGQLTQTAQGQFAALATTATDVTLQATLERAAAITQGKLAEVKIQNGGVQVQGLQALNSMTLQQVNNLSTAYSARNQEEQKAISAEHLKLAKASHAMQVQEFEAKVAEKRANREDLESIASDVRKGAAAMGFKDINAPTNKIIQMINMKDPMYMDMLKAGMMSNTFGTPVVSENPGESARIIAAGAPLRPEQKAIKDMFQRQWQVAASPEGAAKGAYDNTKKDQVTSAAGKFAVSTAQAMQKDINPTDGSNIYAAPPLPSVTMLPAIQKSAWYKSTVQPHIESGALKEFNPEQLVGLTVEALRAKKISFNEAAEGLQGMHSGAARVNNSTKNYNAFGLPAQSSFKVQLSTTPGFTMPSVFDMTSAADVNRLLMARMAAEQRSIIYTNPAVK